MEAAASPRVRSTPAPTFEDGFGRRQIVVSASQEQVEVLVLKRELTGVSGFEAAVRERIDTMATFQHAAFARVRGVARLAKTEGSVGVVSDRIAGVRLSALLAASGQRPLTLDTNGALSLLGQLVTALAALHGEKPGLFHGAVAPERLVLTPEGRLVVVEHVLGSALSTLSLTPVEYWQQLRVLASTSGRALDQQADVAQAAAVGLALLLGCPLGDRYPERIGESKESAALSARAALELLPDDISAWLSRALGIDGRQTFVSAVEASAALSRITAAINPSAAKRAIDAFASGRELPAAPVAVPAGPRPVPAADRPALHVVPPPAAASSSAFKDAAPSHDDAEADGAYEQNAADRDEPGGFAFSSFAVRALPLSRRFLPTTRGTIAAAVAVFVLFATGAVIGAKRYFSPSANGAKGSVAVATNPAGAAVVIDGEQRGHTPVTVELAPGQHVLQVGLDGSSRTLTLALEPGARLSEVIDLPKTQAPTGQLQIVTEPAGARVTLDGQRRGTSPLTLEGLIPGAHTVSVDGPNGPVSQEVTIENGATASVVVPLSAPRDVPTSGWVSVNSPLDLQVFEKGELIGTSHGERITLAAGRHNLDLANETLGFHATRTVNIAAGQATPLRVDTPKGTIALNAVPWADVWIDGERVGETPIGNFQVPIGSHEVIFRHPDLGEQRFTTTVTIGAPARVTADLRRK